MLSFKSCIVSLLWNSVQSITEIFRLLLFFYDYKSLWIILSQNWKANLQNSYRIFTANSKAKIFTWSILQWPTLPAHMMDKACWPSLDGRIRNVPCGFPERSSSAISRPTVKYQFSISQCGSRSWLVIGETPEMLLEAKLTSSLEVT